MIEAAGLRLRAGTFRLRDVTLRCATGRCRAVVGPSGAGKSLLLEALVGLRPIDSGRILVDGEEVTALPAHRRGFAYVPQDVGLFPHLTVRENLLFGPSVTGRFTAETRSLFDRLVEKLALGPLLPRAPAGLSGGERQRVALARALCATPRLLVLDEPFSSIDEASREETRRLLKDLFAEFRATAVCVTHDIDEAQFLADETTVLVAGEVAQEGPSDEVWRYPKRVEVARFHGIRNLYEGTVEAVDARGIRVRPAGCATTLEVTCGCGRERYGPGDPVRFGVRPEAALLEPEGSGGGNALPATLARLLVRGRIHTAILDAGGFTVEVDAARAALRGLPLVPGARFAVRLDPDDICLFE